MKIQVNGASQQVEAGCTAKDLIKIMGLGGKRIAMEVNMEIVPRSSYGEFVLNQDDTIEIVHAVGGG